MNLRRLTICTVLPALLVAMAALGAMAGPAAALLVKLPDGGYANVAPALGPQAPRAARQFDAAFSNLDYSGGPVMPANTNYTVVWQPSNYSGAAFQSGYTAGVDQFFTDLAADSGHPTNSDAVSTQYDDALGQTAAYNSTNGGVLTDTDPLPAGGCGAGVICVTDAQLQAELDHFVAGRGLPADLAHEYFLLTPPSVVVCIDGSGTECSVNATRGQEFCAYHSETAGGHVYAVIPDFVGLGGCDPFVTECPATACAYDNSPADAVLSAVSHEHNESITDPEPNTGWTDWQICGSSSPMTCGGEIGDKCNGDAFADPNIQYQPDGSGNDTPYNETINGRHYLLQREWSNQSRQCLDSFAPSANVASATLTDSSVSGYTVAFNAAGSAATGGVTEYVWQWDDGPGQTTTQETSSPAIEHTFPAPGSYRVALTVMGPDGTSAGTASTVLITRPPSPVAAFTSSGTLLGQPVTFDGRASSAPAGALTTYTWYFGDGTSANGPTASHIYAAARTYTVTLIVADPFGQTGEVSHLVTITAPPAVTPPICVVPRLRGKTLSAAQHALRAAHCTTGRVSRPRHKPRRRGRWKLVVARASPGSGARELAGSGISLALTYVRG